MKGLWRSGILSAVMQAVLGCGQPLYPTIYSGRIVFVSDRDGDTELYVMNNDGTAQTRLTNHPGADGYPSWSPDAQRITFERAEGANVDIYTMNPDGSSVMRLTTATAADEVPRWSPGGDKIAFQSMRDGNWNVYVMNGDGSNQTRLTNDAAADYEPAWSPDGQKIVFVSTRTGNAEIFVMDADGSNVTQLTHATSYEVAPSWSPDGNTIVFASNSSGKFQIWKMNADGSGTVRLTNNTAFDRAPRWSTDGRSILFESDRTGNFDIFQMRADGTNQAQLTSDLHYDVWADSWTGASVNSDALNSMIAFTSTRDGIGQIYKAQADGNGTLRVSHSQGVDHWPSWRHVPSRIVFEAERGPGTSGIITINANGTNESLLTPSLPTVNQTPSFSRDGSWISFISRRDNNQTELYSMAADGSAVQRITNSPNVEGWPQISPSGTKVALTIQNPGSIGLYVMNRDGTGLGLITTGFNLSSPTWSPDATRIAYQMSVNGNEDIYVINVDGSGRRRLTVNPGFDRYPSWSPDGDWIAFVSVPPGLGLSHGEVYVMNADGSGKTRVTHAGLPEYGVSWASAH